MLDMTFVLVVPVQVSVFDSAASAFGVIKETAATTPAAAQSPWIPFIKRDFLADFTSLG